MNSLSFSKLRDLKQVNIEGELGEITIVLDDTKEQFFDSFQKVC